MCENRGVYTIYRAGGVYTIYRAGGVYTIYRAGVTGICTRCNVNILPIPCCILLGFLIAFLATVGGEGVIENAHCPFTLF